jgi:DHA2 family multidrug resistance protein-like MFS transporter
VSLAVPQRRLAFSALILATVIAVLDISAVNLALPSIAADLGLRVDQVLWLSKGNLLACAIAILPCAALGDVIGHRRMLSFGLAMFASTSTGTALSSDLTFLVTLRGLQGCAGAAIMCSTLVLMREIFPAKMLGAALGINALFVAVASTAGPAFCGLILSWLSWRWVFAIGPLLALIAWALGRVYLPEKHLPEHRFDLIGTVLLLGSAGLWIFGDLDSSALWPEALGVLTAALFVLHQRRTRCPILPLGMFLNLRFDYGLTASMIAFIGQSSIFVGMPLVLQQDMGFTPLTAATLFLPWPLMTAVVGPWAGKYADKTNPRVVASIGIAVFCSGLASLALLTQYPAPADIAWRMALCGIGFGLFQSPNNREILTNVRPDHAARGAALLCSARLAGQAIGAAMVSVSNLRPLQLPVSIDGIGISTMLWSNAALQICSLLLGALTWAMCRHLARSRSLPTLPDTHPESQV